MVSGVFDEMQLTRTPVTEVWNGLTVLVRPETCTPRALTDYWPLHPKAQLNTQAVVSRVFSIHYSYEAEKTGVSGPQRYF